MIAKRLTAVAEVLLLEEQNGLRKGRSYMDCIFSGKADPTWTAYFHLHK
jgi:hypothetical protein